MELPNKILQQYPQLKKYIKNTSWVLFEKGIRMTLGFFILTWIIKYLGPSEYGTLSYAKSYAGLFQALVFMGINEVLIRELIYHKERTDTLMGTIFFLKVLGTFVSWILMGLSLCFLTHSSEQIIFILLFSFWVLIGNFSVFESFFSSRLLSKYWAISKLIALFISSLARIAFILNDLPTIFFVLIFIVDVLIYSSLYFIFYYKEGKSIFKWKVDFALMEQLVKKNWPFFAVTIIPLINVELINVFLQHMINATAVGYYAATMKIYLSLVVMVTLIVDSLFPAILNSLKEAPTKAALRIQKILDLIILIFLCICPLIIIFSHKIIDTLYGKDFSISAEILDIQIFCGFLYVIGHLRMYWMLAENLQWYNFLYSLVEFIFHIVFNVLFIHLYGVKGAVFGILTAQWTTFFLTTIFIKEIRPFFFSTLKGLYNILSLKFINRNYYQ